MSKKGNRMEEEKRIELKRTGITALDCSETFLLTSYIPSRSAEISASINHIEKKKNN